jgi:hypothetical protein
MPILRACLMLCALAGASGLVAVSAQTGAQADLADLIRQATTQRRAYTASFKDVTATETKTTEVFDEQGRVEKQRVVVSDFLTYESRFTPGVVSEYRIAREVDGRDVSRAGKRTIDSFERLAAARTLEQERGRLIRENLAYTLRYFRWDVTLSPVPQLGNPGVIVSLGGRARLGPHEAVILSYRRDEMRTGEFGRLLRSFKNPRTGNRGRLWLDAETFRLLRWENEATVVDRDLSTEVAVTRDEIDYGTSASAPVVPTRIVTSFFEKTKSGGAAGVRLAGRITYAYSTFRRFQTETGYQITSGQ